MEELTNGRLRVVDRNLLIRSHPLLWLVFIDLFGCRHHLITCNSSGCAGSVQLDSQVTEEQGCTCELLPRPLPDIGTSFQFDHELWEALHVSEV